ncbi:Csu type fimbrial protein [Allosphingosinicella sp.]|jgi:spore coat protein U-like protein|uniref:Csu type fimbrial protein n=1 Tax=Allosphingosinicella sp. TaxID=2823234 RepID=UPI002F1EA155
MLARSLPAIGKVLAGLFLAVLGSVLQPAPAHAGINSCSISSSGIIFSPYDSQTQLAVNGTGTITVTCTGDGPTNGLSLNLTGGNAGSCSTRQMRKGSESLNYQVFRESGRVNAFCDGGSRLDINMDFTTGGTQTQTYTMYGRVSASQNPTYGAYSDLLSVSLKKGGGTIATTTASISGSVAPICTASAGTLGFGNYSTASAAVSSASVSVNCSNGASYQVSLGGGQNLNGTSRRMVGPSGAFLSYQLFSNSGRTIAWGDGTALGAKVNGTGNGLSQGLTVYGRIPAGQSPNPGSYSDTVVVTVEY